LGGITLQPLLHPVFCQFLNQQKKLSPGKNSTHLVHLEVGWRGKDANFTIFFWSNQEVFLVGFYWELQQNTSPATWKVVVFQSIMLSGSVFGVE